MERRIYKLEQALKRASWAERNNVDLPAHEAQVIDDLLREEERRADEPEPRRSAPDVPAEARDHEAEGQMGFASFGQFLQFVHAEGTRSTKPLDASLVRPAQHYANAIVELGATLTQGTPSSGGFLVPTTFSESIWDDIHGTENALLPRTDIYEVDGKLFYPAGAETSRAAGSRYGGVRGYWIAEGESITESDPTVRALEIEPQELAVAIKASSKVLRNSSRALEKYIRQSATAEISFLVDAEIVNGNGSGRPLGVLKSPALVTVAKETNQPADSILSENVEKMISRLHPNARRGAIWLANVDTQPELNNLFRSVKNVAGAENVGGYEPGLYDRNRQTLAGLPVIFSEHCQTIGDLGDLILWQPRWYISAVRRGGIDAATSMHVYFLSAHESFRFMFAVNGQPWLQSAITPANGTNTLSSHIALAARS